MCYDQQIDHVMKSRWHVLLSMTIWHSSLAMLETTGLDSFSFPSRCCTGASIHCQACRIYKRTLQSSVTQCCRTYLRGLV